jgi:hypothetical protein
MIVRERIPGRPSAPPGADWERRCWKGAAGLRVERGRIRRRFRTTALVGAVFFFALLQVRLSTEVAERGSRISRLQADLKRMEVDLAVARANLASRQIYGELIGPAQEGGFTTGGLRRTISVELAAPEPQADLMGRMRSDLSRGARLLLPEALAQDVWVDDQGRAQRP